MKSQGYICHVIWQNLLNVLKINKPWWLNDYWTLPISWYLILVLKWLTKTEAKYKSNQESTDQKTLKNMN